jgi:hypothetical protein
MGAIVEKSLFKDLKDRGEDFEFYPTTNEIIEVLYQDAYKIQKRKRGVNYSHVDLLDIGAGDGKIFTAFKNISKGIDKEENKLTVKSAYAIEKSNILINAMPEDIYIIGTDFWDSTLIDKKVDVIYSNPPYSMFSTWSEKIIKEANAEYVYLLIPERWKNDAAIKNAIDLRKATSEIVGTFSFEESEDRKARASVNLVRVTLRHDQEYRKTLKVDPFDLWFKETYPFEKEVSEEDISDSNKERREKNEAPRPKGARYLHSSKFNCPS